MKNIVIILSFGLFYISASCKDDKESVPQGCCDNPAIEDSFGNTHVYVPNIFTPNGDGINDLLQVYGDSIDVITSMEIRDDEDLIVFEVTNVVPFEPAASWDGAVNGIVKEGLYSIALTVMAEDGTVKILEGEVCNYPCGDLQLNDISSIDQCKFPTQVMDGQYDPTIPSGENSDCFE